MEDEIESTAAGEENQAEALTSNMADETTKPRVAVSPAPAVPINSYSASAN